MGKMTGKIGRKKRIISFFILGIVTLFPSFAEWDETGFLGHYDITITNVSLQPPDAIYSEKVARVERPEIEVGRFYETFFGWQSISDVKNNKYIITVTNTESGVSLRYDFTEFVTTPDNFNEYWNNSSLIFFENGRCIDMMLEKSSAHLRLIRFDFEKKNVSLIRSIDFHKVYKEMFSDDAKNLYTKSTAWNMYHSLTNARICPAVFQNRKVCESTFNQRLAFILTCSENEVVTDFSQAEYESYLKKYVNETLTRSSYYAKSELQEGSVVYRAKNLGEYSDMPWVSAKKDIREEVLVIEAEKNMYALEISNGFYRKGKEYLFTANSRPRELLITFDGYDSPAQRVILKDSPEPQLIPLLYTSCNRITIRFGGVYHGNKYSDVCINSIRTASAPSLDALSTGDR